MNDAIPLLDLHAQFRSIEPQVREAIDRVLASQHFILGPEVEGLEKETAAYVSCAHGIGVSSGSDALLMALMALELPPGSEVITSPYTFFATVGAIVRAGLKPVFVDIDPKTYNLDAGRLAEAITARTRVVMPVHLFGQSADMHAVMGAIEGKNIVVLEDAAQAIGTEFQGRRVGGIGAIGCFSFFPSKNLGAFGDAGLVTTQDPGLAEKLRIFRAHGSKPKYFHRFVGGNFRIDAIQAAILRVKFAHLDAWTRARQQNAARYDRMFQEAGVLGAIEAPWVRPGDRHIFNQYIIRARDRDGLKAHLAKDGIQTEVYYPRPMHLQECFSNLGYREDDFPESERAARESLAIPVYPELTAAQQERVVASIVGFLRR